MSYYTNKLFYAPISIRGDVLKLKNKTKMKTDTKWANFHKDKQKQKSNNIKEKETPPPKLEKNNNLEPGSYSLILQGT